MKKIPWLSPDETQEAIEILQDAAKLIRIMSEYGGMRKDLRIRFNEQARECEDFALRASKANLVDESVITAVNELIAKKLYTKDFVAITFADLLTEALEDYISRVNKP